MKVEDVSKGDNSSTWVLPLAFEAFLFLAQRFLACIERQLIAPRQLKERFEFTRQDRRIGRFLLVVENGERASVRQGIWQHRQSVVRR